MQLDAWSQAEQKRGTAEKDHVTSAPMQDKITLKEIMEEIWLLKNDKKNELSASAY